MHKYCIKYIHFFTNFLYLLVHLPLPYIKLSLNYRKSHQIHSALNHLSQVKLRHPTGYSLAHHSAPDAYHTLSAEKSAYLNIQIIHRHKIHGTFTPSNSSKIGNRIFAVALLGGGSIELKANKLRRQQLVDRELATVICIYLWLSTAISCQGWQVKADDEERGRGRLLCGLF